MQWALEFSLCVLTFAAGAALLYGLWRLVWRAAAKAVARGVVEAHERLRRRQD